MIGKMTDLNSGVLRAQSLYASLHLVGKRTFLVAAWVLLLLVLQPSVQAASISYLDPPPGNTVDYTDVTEASGTDPVPLFGAPTVTGDSIDFNPVLFTALSQFGAPPVDLTDGQLTFKVHAHAGYAIKNISFNEGGITTVIGAGTANTYTDVSATGFLNISEVDGAGISVVVVPINLTFSHNANGTWRLVPDGLALTLPWTGGQLIDLNAALTAASVPYTLGATRISVNLNNGLIAQSEAGTIAFIDKKDFGGLSITVNVPEPTTMLLALASFGVLGLITRRR
jgi:hypothetical protein